LAAFEIIKGNKMPDKNLIVSNEEQLVLAILEMQELLKKLRVKDIPDKDEFIKAISFIKK
jgi:hypothetical protein